MRLSAIEKQKKRPPGRTLLLEPGVFADVWPEKPRAAVCVGLRLMSQDDRTKARFDAEKIARDAHPQGGVNQIDAFNDALMRCCIASGLCDPNDVQQPSALFQHPQDDVFDALTSQGAKTVYQALERYEIESSALAHEPSDEEVDELVDHLISGALDRMLPSYGALCRRLLGYVLEQLRKVSALPESGSS
jgi:hypothetical protein